MGKIILYTNEVGHFPEKENSAPHISSFVSVVLSFLSGFPFFIFLNGVCVFIVSGIRLRYHCKSSGFRDP